MATSGVVAPRNMPETKSPPNRSWRKSMSLTRRRFVQGASLSLLAGTSIPAVLAQAVSGAKDAAFDPENLSAFSGISIRTFYKAL